MVILLSLYFDSKSTYYLPRQVSSQGGSDVRDSTHQNKRGLSCIAGEDGEDGEDMPKRGRE